MSYAAIVAGLQTRLGTVTDLKVRLDYEPTSIQDLPATYLLLDSYTRSQAGQLTVMKYRVLIRTLIRWQENKQAEVELMAFVNSIPEAIEQDAQLGGAIVSGLSTPTDGKAGWVNIGGTQYRALDHFIEVIEKTPYAGAV